MDARFGASLGRVGSVGWTRRDDADVRMTGREGLDQVCVTVRQRASRCAVCTERYPSEDFKRVNYVSHRPEEISSARPNARVWTALVTETHTDFGK